MPLSANDLPRYLIPDAVRMVVANRGLMGKLNLEKFEELPEFDDIRALSDEQLKTYLEAEWTRAKELDEKLNKLTATLTVGVTIGGAVAKTIFDGLAPTLGKAVVAFLLMASMGFFFSGAMIGFSGLRPKPRYGYGAGFLRATASDDDKARSIRAQAAAGFQITNIVRQNEAVTAIGLIKWGVVAFTVALLTSFLVPKEPTEPKPPIIIVFPSGRVVLDATDATFEMPFKAPA